MSGRPIDQLPPTLRARILAARRAWGLRPAPVVPEQPGPGQESVWHYPRPPVVQAVDQPVRVMAGGLEMARSTRALRVLETASAPALYIPPDDVAMDRLEPAGGEGICEWKGLFVHYDLLLPGRRIHHAAWSFPDPFTDLEEGYGQLAGHIAFYPGRVDACFIGTEQVRPQPGGYYGGWVTSNLTGPIKGLPGSEGW